MTTHMATKRTQGDRRPGKIREELVLRGGAVYSTCVGFAYPKNGNVHNPTPRLLWVATLNGTIVSRASTRKAVVKDLLEALRPTGAGMSDFDDEMGLP